MVRRCVLQLVSLNLWHALSPGRRETEFKVCLLERTPRSCGWLAFAFAFATQE